MTANLKVSKNFLDGRRAILSLDESKFLQRQIKRSANFLLSSKIALYAAGDFISGQAFLAGRRAGDFVGGAASKAYSAVRRNKGR